MLDKNAVGRSSPPTLNEVEKGAIRRFAEALGDVAPMKARSKILPAPDADIAKAGELIAKAKRPVAVLGSSAMRLADPALYRDHPQEVQSLNQRYAAIDRELASFLVRWEELEAARTCAG